MRGSNTAREVEALFVGEDEGMERELVKRENVTFAPIRAGAMHGVGLVQKVIGAGQTALGTANAVGVLNRFKPDVVLLTGGFVGVPVSVAAWLKRVPSVVYLPDIEPGLALKVMEKFATKVATTTEASSQFIDERKMIVTGYPVREAFANVSRESARAKLNIDAKEKVLLVFGGSKGARSINTAVMNGLVELLRECVVIHVIGERDWEMTEATRASMTSEQRSRYRAYKYLHEEMADAMAAADLAVCRSGASALGELPAVGLPAILVPYPNVWQYQKVNAQYLVDKGSAILLEDENLDGELASRVVALMRDATQLKHMRDSALRIARHDGAEQIARVVIAQVGA